MNPEPDLIKKFLNIDETIASKLYTHEHLVKPLEESYVQFLEQYLKEFFEENSKIPLINVLDKKTSSTTQYFLNIKKYTLDPVYYRGPDRVRKQIDSKLAIQYGLSRELALNVQLYVSQRQRNNPESQVNITKLKTMYQLGRLPLLINSKYDLQSKRSLLSPYYFIINGSPRVLYNVLDVNNSVKIFNLSSKNEVSIRISTDPLLKNNPLIVETLGDKVYLGNRIGSKKRDLGKVLRLLNVAVKDVLKQPKTKIDDLFLINYLSPYYKGDLKEVYHSYALDLGFHKQMPWEDLKTLVDQDLSSFLCSSEDFEKEIQLKKVQCTQLLIEILEFKQDPHSKYMDSLENKKLMAIRNHFIRVFNQSFKQILQRAKSILLKDLGLVKKTRALSHLIRSQIIKKAFRKYLSQVDTATNIPHSEFLSYNNSTFLPSSQRKVVSTLSKSITLAKYRSVNPSKSGRLCPIHTPYSRSVGLVQNLALGAKIAPFIPYSVLKNVLGELSNTQELANCKVYVNDKFVGYHSDSPQVLHQKVYKLKRKHLIGVVLKGQQLYINASEGRLMRPVYVVEKQEVLITKLTEDQYQKSSLQDLISKGYITYIDFQEQMNSVLAAAYEDVRPQTRYLNLNPASCVSFLGNMLPMISNNAAHRGSLSLRLLDQAVGGKGTKPSFEYNQTKVEYLINADPSIFTTPLQSILEETIGQNMILCFQAQDNEEDSVTLNQSAIQRGLLDTVMCKKVSKEVPHTNNVYAYKVNDKLEIPVPNLQKDHLPKVGCIVDQTPVLLLDLENDLKKVSKVKSPPTPFYLKEASINSPLENSCVIDFTFSKLRKVQIGDKIGTRNGLKGVISKTVSQLQLLIPETGVNPSLYISNHTITSRMILGSLLELYLGKAAVSAGKIAHSPIFANEKEIEDMVLDSRRTLLQNGLDQFGYENVYNVKTLKSNRLNIGPIKTYLLIHHARDKYYVRTDKGGVSFLTHQPGSGRSVQGGLKFGEMQINAAIEHGATEFIKDRINIDTIQVKICKCGYLADTQKPNAICKICNAEAQLKSVNLPYPFVVFSKILKAGHIATRFELDQQTNEDSDQEPIDMVSNEQDYEVDDQDQYE